MARRRRIIVPGLPYHVTHRGNRREPLFFTDFDRLDYLRILKEYSDRFGLDHLAYCLMTNHVHLIVRPRESSSLSRVIGCAHGLYCRRLNHRRGTDGHCWSSRYFSCPLDDHHLWEAIRYVELNPVRARIVADAADYRWSSARANALGGHDALLSPARPVPGEAPDWTAWLAEGLPDDCAARIRTCTERGWACGSPDFVRLLEKRTGAKFSPARIGRPLKSV